MAVFSPAYYQQEPLAPLQASGTAASNVMVRSIAIGVYADRTATLVAQGQATLTVLDATHVSWSWRWTTPSPGGYTFAVTATDKNGIKTKSSVVFDVSDSSGQAFLTLLAGRTVDTIAAHCKALPGAVPITQVADSLHQLGISGVGAVVTGWIQEATHSCVQADIYPSWAELASMRDVDGWSFVSEGPDHSDVTSLTSAQQYAAACGSLLPLLAHGHTRPWGLFAYPGNNVSMTMQTTITDRCYTYGRTYLPRRNHLEDLGFPYLQNSINVDGGACNDLSQPCATLSQKRYFSLDRLGQLMQSGPGEWTVLQSYKFVTGKYGGLTSRTPAWDCTSPDWHEHWSNSLEVYCWNDYLNAVNTIPPTVTVTDPATVAAAWNQRSAPPRTSFTTGVAATTTGGDATWTFTADDPRSWFTCSLDHATAQACDSGFAITGLRPGPHTLDVTAIDSFGQSATPATWNWTVNHTVAIVPAADTTVTADATASGYPITVTVTQPNGTPAVGQPVSVTTTETLVTPAPPAGGYTTDAAGRIQVVLTDSVAGDRGAVEVAVAAGGAGTSGRIVVDPGVYASSTVGAVSPMATAGAQVSGMIHVFDAEGNSTDVSVPAFSLGGSLVQASPNGTPATSTIGTVAMGQLPFTVTPTLAQGAATLTVTDGSGTASSVSVDVGPAPATDTMPGSLALTADPTGSADCAVSGQTVTVGPDATCAFGVAETDFYGNQIADGASLSATLSPGQTPDGGTLTLGGATTASDSTGTVGGSAPLSGGTAAFLYTAPGQLHDGGSGQFTVSVAGGAPFAVTPGSFQVVTQLPAP